MATKHLSVELTGERELQRALQFGSSRVQEGLWDILEDIAQRGEHYAKLYAPSYTGELQRRIGHTKPHPWMSEHGPGLEAKIGLSGPAYALYVHGGTGIYRRSDPKLIRPNKPGGVMTFQKRGETRRFRRYTRGQEKYEFMRLTYELLKQYAGQQGGHILRRVDTRI